MDVSLKNSSLIQLAVALILTLVPVFTMALERGVSPYLPVNMSPEAERQIERLMVLAGDPILTRPIPAVRVNDAISRYCKKPSRICKQVRRYLSRFMHSDGFTYANLGLYSKSDQGVPLANQRGEESDNAAEINAQIYLRLNSNWYAFLGGERREDGESLEGTFSSVGWDWMQLDLGYRPHWFSPMQQSAMLKSTNAETTASVTLSSPSEIGFLGFRYELFVTRLSKSDNIAYQGGTTSGKPCAIGMHLGINPVKHVAFGLNRIMMYGGGERGECHKPKNLFKAFFDPSSADNTSKDLNSDQEFGNQFASITSRINIPGRVPVSVYFEYGGEDTSVNKVYRVGNQALQGGVYFPELIEGFDLTYEYSEWQNGWYVHHIYRDGPFNGGNVIGHYAADQRSKGDGAGGRSSYLGANYDLVNGHLLHLSYRTIQQASYSPFNYSQAHEFSTRYSVPNGNYIWGLEGVSGVNVWDDDFYRVGLFIRW